jgi:hypothetical protein
LFLTVLQNQNCCFNNKHICRMWNVSCIGSKSGQRREMRKQHNLFTKKKLIFNNYFYDSSLYSSFHRLLSVRFSRHHSFSASLPSFVIIIFEHGWNNTRTILKLVLYSFFSLQLSSLFLMLMLLCLNSCELWVSNYEKCSDDFKKRVLTQNKREQPESERINEDGWKITLNFFKCLSNKRFNDYKHPNIHSMMRTNKWNELKWVEKPKMDLMELRKLCKMSFVSCFVLSSLSSPSYLHQNKTQQHRRWDQEKNYKFFSFQLDL